MGSNGSVKTGGIREFLDGLQSRVGEAANGARQDLEGINLRGAAREISEGFETLFKSSVEGIRRLPEAIESVDLSKLPERIRQVRFSNVKAYVRGKPFFTLAMAIGIIYLGSLPFQAAAPEVPPPAVPFQRNLIKEPTISVYFHETDDVREMKIEEYLEGVVAGEMNPGWPREALAAQAIVARTFTWKKILDGGVPERGTDASTNEQEFQAYSAEAVTDAVEDAVRMTRGEIVTHQGEPILAWFHASSGGRTATAQEGLEFDDEPTPYIQVVKDVDLTEDLEWQRSFSLQEIETAAREVGVNTGPVRSIKIGRKGPSGRALTLRINGKTVSAPQFRLALGSEAMRSTLLTSISISGGKVMMRGRGFGHGVGLSQWGAWSMSNDGKSPEEIVSFYFKNTRIERLWE